tara:strand:- start:6696 stop:6878 length:183 start_codon:yes stop_codon:yes gene_type:complete
MKSGREKRQHALSFSRGDDGRRSFLRVVIYLVVLIFYISAERKFSTIIKRCLLSNYVISK